MSGLVPAPVKADTPEKQWEFQCRAWELLHEEHRAKRAVTPDVAEFKKWEREQWIPKMKKLSIDRNAALDGFATDEKKKGKTGDDLTAALATAKTAGAKDATWDSDIDLSKV